MDVFHNVHTDGVHLHLTRADAVKLFHAVNRCLAVIDDQVPEFPDAGDQVSYDRANAFLAQLQRELQIEPE